jgi:hypothetical protein
MEFSYGNGTYIEGKKRFKGRIILSEHKLFLKDEEGDVVQTYIPLEKIERIRQTRQGLEVHARPTLYFRFAALIQGERKDLSGLVKDLVKRRGLKKQFLKKEWIESES